MRFMDCNSSLLLLVLLILRCCDGFKTFGFEIHHRFSDPVKGVLSIDDMPEMGSREYHVYMSKRDRVIHGRGLVEEEPLTFDGGNETFSVSSLGFLHFANVSLGTPSMSFFVALDTGSDLFWLPCDCISCVKSLVSSKGERLELNIYSPNTSTTSTKVPCNSSMCEYRSGCSEVPGKCPYQAHYLSNNTSSTGVLVEDVLHLTGEDNQPKVVDARITFGCGQVQTGSFLDGAAPNGLFGLGMEKLSVPSILSSAGFTANSFSMCFGYDGTGRISFGDKGSLDQKETPFSVNNFHPMYNISVTQISVGKNLTDADFSAIFDTGTSYTYLNDPAYTYLTESFNSQAQDKRRPSDSWIPFEFCYDISSNKSQILLPNVTLTMKGGSEFPVLDPVALVSDEAGLMYCLCIIKSSNINIIGQNFMTGNRIVFDREKLVLGWKQSNCDSDQASTTVSTTPSKAVPPATSIGEATKETGNVFHPSAGTSCLNPIRYTFFIMFLLVLASLTII